MAHVAVEHLTFTYPGAAGPALRDVSLEVARGSFVVLCGANGSGKTTLLRHLKPALAPHGTRSGAVLLGGHDALALDAREQAAEVAFVAQDPDEQIVTDRVWHELAFGLENLGVEQAQMRARVAEMASFLGIGGWFHRDTAELSGGQKQLLNLAAAMVLQPPLLVLDEPTAQLDPVAAGDFLTTVRTLNRELGTTVVMTEHRLEEAFSLADQAVVMDRGAVALRGEPAEVALGLQRAGHPMAAALPTPARVWFAVGEAAEKNGAGADTPVEGRHVAETPAEVPSARKGDAAGPCPLTVRAGRDWLAEKLGAHGVNDAMRAATGETFSSAAAPYAANANNAGGSSPSAPREAAYAPPALRMREVWFRYARDEADVLRGASLTVASGELYALLGANGAGKSTLLKAACGVCAPQRGSVEVFGERVRRGGGAKRARAGRHGRGAQTPDPAAALQARPHRLAMLPQDPANLFSRQTVREELAEAAARAVAPRDNAAPAEPAAARIGAVARLCGLEGLLDRNPRDLSGGERQRAGLAKVLLVGADLLLLDEPTKGLDATAKQDLARLLARLKANGATVVVVSHDVEFCAEHADRVGLFFDGQVVSEGAPREFFSANAFYTTAARRMGRGLVEGAVTAGDLVKACMPHRDAR